MYDSEIYEQKKFHGIFNDYLNSDGFRKLLASSILDLVEIRQITHEFCLKNDPNS